MKKALVISVVGSGGKTTFIEQTAQEVKKRKKQAAVLTTTHMWIPKSHCFLGEKWEDAAEMLREAGIMYFGKPAKTDGKMVFTGEENYRKLCTFADVVLVEADGAKEKPMKIPDWSKEPVIPENTDRIIVLFGLSALGKPLKEVCHRWELGKNWEIEKNRETDKNVEIDKNRETDKNVKTGKNREIYLGNEPVDRELALMFLRRGYLDVLAARFPKVPITVFLNQADDQERRKAGSWIKEKLKEEGVACEVVQMKEKQMKEKKTIAIAVIYMASGYGKRFGRNKLLEEVNGKPLYLHGLEKWIKCRKGIFRAEEPGREKNNPEEVCQIQCSPDAAIQIKLILVSQYSEILEYGRRQGIICVKNQQADEGITASIRLGIKAAGQADYYLFSVADQPGIRQITLETFLQEFLAAKGRCSIGCMCAKGSSGGNPVIFHQRYREELLALRGDKGGSQVLRRFPQEVFRFFAEEEELRDIDRISDI